MISPASKKTGMAMTRPVIPSAQAAFLSPKRFTMVTARVCAPPETSNMAPNIEPRPTNSAIPFNVLPMPSLTAVTIVSKGMPAMRPMVMAPTRMETMAWILNLMINTSRMASPINAAIINRAGSSDNAS